MKNNIVIIDSGMGGLSVLKNMCRALPMFNYVYFADTKNLPYGEKTKAELIEITIANIHRILKEYNPTLIVFGCNTIGTNIFSDIQKIFSTVKMFALVPNIKQTLKQKYEHILVLGTTRTIQTLSKTCHYRNYKNRIILCKMPLLATKVENHLQNTKKIVPYLKSRLSNYHNADCIILGCSHYYFVKKQIKTIVKNAKIIDGVKILVNEIKRYLKINNLVLNSINANQSPKIKLVVTGNLTDLKTYNAVIKNIIKTM